MSREELEKRVQSFVDQLGEHVDSVRVFITFPTHDGHPNTAGFNSGIGNFYAQYGQVREWMLTQDERVRENVRREEGDDSE
jgi:hypothetical protein